MKLKFSSFDEKEQTESNKMQTEITRECINIYKGIFILKENIFHTVLAYFAQIHIELCITHGGKVIQFGLKVMLRSLHSKSQNNELCAKYQ